jgi:thioredoxin-like negative regulator of GroEL
LPAFDKLAGEYEGRVAVVGPAWKSSLEDTAAVAERLLSSGKVMWGLDAEQEIFEAFGVGGQPAGAIIAADGSLVSTWRGARNPDQIREILDSLLAEA